ncbi:putative Heme biosynthesis protein (modular protein) [Nitrospina gracilis 3/211]|uniref:Putative Heme biosynthesis protein (Modular protein) n=1 Tax=Nitrospina gracilis (strain 3/211) TaxID=1266370 RepID=M1YH49_NITG3|nr:MULTISPECIES: radical SAM protein [Nitrospina]MCF8722822.1 radical SAM protein with 4Fe4S-binding SPASM domain [Nitrospina sp. Nb-3]CCQ89779.1 putative Heme biosynthesis protein (modular protein) [Nitrospina gracilis 3/211]
MTDAPKDDLSTICSGGWAALQDGDHEGARRALSQALKHPEIDTDPYARQEILRGLAWCAYHIACRDENLTELEDAIETAARIFDLVVPDTRGVHREANRLLGWCFQKQGDADRAVDHFNRAVALVVSEEGLDDVTEEIERGRALAQAMLAADNRLPFVDSLANPKLLSHVPLTQFDLPEYIEIEPTLNCNLRCVQCHVSYQRLSEERLDLKFLDHMRGVEGKWVVLGSNYEPMAHPQFAEIVEGLAALDMKIDLTTNGTLLTPRVIERIRHADFHNVVISFDGIRRETYERIRRHAEHAAALERIGQFKEAVTSPNAYFAVNNTLMRSSLDELPETVAYWERAGFDHLGLIVMVLRDDNPTLRAESLEPVMDMVTEKVEAAARWIIENDCRITLSAAALNHTFPLRERFPELFSGGCVRSRNPRARLPFDARNYFQDGAYPGMPVDCRSPFKFARILHNGDVQLCYQFIVGNVHEEPFLDIWFGKRAQGIRENIRRRPEVCHACEYYNFCIKAGEVNLNLQENFYSDLVLNQHKYLTADSVLEEYKGFNIVPWLDQYYGIPLILGPVNTYHFLCREGFVKYGLVWAENMTALKKKIDTRWFYVHNPLFWVYRKLFLKPGTIH